MTVDVKNEQSHIELDIGLIKKAAYVLLKNLNLSEFELSILILDNESITQLNKKYLGKNTPTNVLAFGMQEGELNLKTKKKILGDVVVSAEMAKVCSEDSKLDFYKELILYIIHGVLHLLGYRDDTGTARKKMERKQEELLGKVGF